MLISNVENGNYISMVSGIVNGIQYKVVINKSNNMGIELCPGYEYKSMFYKMSSDSKEDILENLDFVYLI